MTLLTAIRQACFELGIPAPAVVFGSADPTVQQLQALASREGRDFFQMETPQGGHPRLRKEYTFNLVPVGPYTGTVIGGTNTVTALSSIVGLVVGYGVAGGNIPQSATIVSIDSATQITMSAYASGTATLTGQTIQFGKIAYDLPSDYDFMIAQTHWDRAFRWQLLGPLDPQEWQTLVSGISPVGPRIRYRLMANKFYINPLPGASQTDQIAYEYASNAWCLSAGGVAQTDWAADTDTYLFNEDTLILGVKWRWRKAKGFDYDDDHDEWEAAVARDIARAGGNRSLPLNATSSANVRLLNGMNVPDSGFGT